MGDDHEPFPKKSRTTESDDVLPWQDKYRPAILNQVVGQDETLSVLKSFMIHRKFPHLLFHGPPGTGKTSTILALARQLYGDASMSQMVLELNAGDDRSVHDVQTRIKTFASTRPIFKVRSRGCHSFNMFKLVILDEADTMDHTAQMALRRIIEDYAGFTRFCIITNNIYKLSPALISRCARLRFPPLCPSAIHTLISQVATTENIQIRPEALEYLSTVSYGDMRQALAVLQECHLKTLQKASTSTLPADGVISTETIHEYTHTRLPSDISLVIEEARRGNYSRCIISINRIKSEKALNLADLLTALAVRLQHVQVPAPVKTTWLEALSEIEANLACGGSEEIQTGALVGAIKNGWSLMDPKGQVPEISDCAYQEA